MTDMEKRRLGNLATYVNGYAFKPADWKTEGLPIIRIQNLTGTSKQINYYDGEYPEKVEVNNGDVLISWSASLGVHIWNGGKAVLNQHIFKVVFDKDEINKEYFVYAVKHSLDVMISHMHGATMKHIVKRDFDNVQIHYPSMADQMKSAEILSVVESIIEKRKGQIEDLDTLIKSRFVEMFESDAYDYVKLKDVCDFITKGTTPRAKDIMEEPFEDSIPYLKVYNLSYDGQMLFEGKPQYISKSIHSGGLKRSKVYPDDVLMNIVGPPLGKFALVPDTYEEWNINQAIAIFRATEQIIPRYLLYSLIQPRVLQPFIDAAVGIRQQNLNLEQCRNLEVPLPPLKLQMEFADFVQHVDKLKLKVQESLNETQLLFNSLMQEYFE